MTKAQKSKAIIFAIITLVFLTIGIIWSKQRLTYIECKTFNSPNDTYITLQHDNEALVQEFIMPYELLHDISIKIGTFCKDNNSTWSFFIKEKNTGKIIFEKEFNASLIEDNSYFSIKINKNVHVDKGEKYQFGIVANDVDENSCLAFFTSEVSNADDAELLHNGNGANANLCFKVYGGDKDNWWTGFVIIIFLYVLIVGIRGCVVWCKKGNLFNDVYIQGLLISGVTFLLLASFAVAYGFCDESDNMYGGMVIANGGVLYRDYVTQHTPVTYYLCALFALLGAGSVEQFRLSYYLLEALIWGIVYIRHVNNFGWKKMLSLPILEVICISSVICLEGTQVLSDGIQGILFVILLLEYLVYLKDKKLDWPRCCIISICFWGSFGAAFVSAYALVWVVLVVIIIEIVDWSKREVSFKGIVQRYYKLLIAIVVPFLAAVIYFKANHSLRRAFEQFYSFNREVYPKYAGGLGDNIAQPFINGVQNFFIIISDNFNSIINAEATNVIIIQLLILVLAVGFLIIMYEKKKFWEASVFFLVMIFSATRGYGFHGLASWYVAIMIIALNIEMIYEKLPKFAKPLLGLLSVVLLSTYVIAVGNNLLYQQTSVSEMESTIIDLTEDDDNKDIYLDVWTSGSLYYFYKERYPVNCAVFMLPWYMDWYEQDNIDALIEKEPKVVVYNEDEVTWGHQYYTVAFATQLKKNYTRLGNNPSDWEYSVWVRND